MGRMSRSPACYRSVFLIGDYKIGKCEFFSISRCFQHIAPKKVCDAPKWPWIPIDINMEHCFTSNYLCRVQGRRQYQNLMKKSTILPFGGQNRAITLWNWNFFSRKWVLLNALRVANEVWYKDEKSDHKRLKYARLFVKKLRFQVISHGACKSWRDVIYNKARQYAAPGTSWRHR